MGVSMMTPTTFPIHSVAEENTVVMSPRNVASAETSGVCKKTTFQKIYIYGRVAVDTGQGKKDLIALHKKQSSNRE